MKEIIKLVGKYGDMELGYVEGGTYYHMGLFADDDHSWKILAWIDQNLEDKFPIYAVKEPEKMMEESQRKNQEVLDGIVKEAFRNSPE